MITLNKDVADDSDKAFLFVNQGLRKSSIGFQLFCLWCSTSRDQIAATDQW